MRGFVFDFGFPRLVHALLMLLLVSNLVNNLASAQEKPNVLMTIPLAGGQAKKLVEQLGLSCGSPCWSPDGKWIAYDSLPSYIRSPYHMGKIMAVSADGSKKLELGLGGIPTWSPDGKSLAWHTYSPYGVVVASFDEQKGASGAGVEQILDHWGSPVWLNDPRYLITIRSGLLASYDFHTGEESVFHRPQKRIAFGYSISPAGDRVCYRTAHKNGDLYLANVSQDGTGGDRLLLSGGVSSSSWTPDGRQLVVSWIAPGKKLHQLYTLDVEALDAIDRAKKEEDDRTDSRNVTVVRIRGQDSAVDCTLPNLSKDGKQIVFVATPQTPKE